MLASLINISTEIGTRFGLLRSKLNNSRFAAMAGWETFKSSSASSTSSINGWLMESPSQSPLPSYLMIMINESNLFTALFDTVECEMRIKEGRKKDGHIVCHHHPVDGCLLLNEVCRCCRIVNRECGDNKPSQEPGGCTTT